MVTGKLKMWNGFIADDQGGPDTFLHINELKAAGIDPDDLRLGERLSFDTANTREGRTKASNVRRA
jgi:cold shock CspA family protein